MQSVMSYVVDFVSTSKRTGEVVESIMSHLVAYFKGKAVDAVTSTVSGMGKGAIAVGSVIGKGTTAIGHGISTICSYLMFWKKSSQEEIRDEKDEEERRERERQFY